MKEKTIRKLVKLVEEADIESLTVRNWWSTVRINKRLPNGGNGGKLAENTITIPAGEVRPTLPPVQQTTESGAAAPSTPEPKPEPIGNHKELTTPMVGTFYTSPEPGAPNFVDVGQRVKKGQTLCIIEAMKLMNEIEAEYDCVIVERLVENAEPVEYGQAIFVVEPA
jgi:acetyl-CoA carboxylase biotin carboxyl carrier protein